MLDIGTVRSELQCRVDERILHAIGKHLDLGGEVKIEARPEVKVHDDIVEYLKSEKKVSEEGIAQVTAMLPVFAAASSAFTHSNFSLNAGVVILDNIYSWTFIASSSGTFLMRRTCKNATTA